MHLAGVDLLLWAIGLLGHVLLLFVLCIRRRAARFPVFTTLIATNVIRTIALYFTFRLGTWHAYFFTYWSLAILDVALQLAVVYEMASHVFRPLGKWTRDVHRGFLWLIGGSIAVASLLTWMAAPAAPTLKEVVVIKGSFFSAALMSELFVGMVAFSVIAGLPWKTHVARISQGLGAYSIVCILIEAGHSYSIITPGTPTYVMLSHIRMAVYLVCITYWIVMLWRNAPRPKDLPDEMHRQLSLLQSRVAYDLYRIRSWRG
jgi:hypothetical protein